MNKKQLLKSILYVIANVAAIIGVCNFANHLCVIYALRGSHSLVVWLPAGFINALLAISTLRFVTR